MSQETNDAGALPSSIAPYIVHKAFPPWPTRLTYPWIAKTYGMICENYLAVTCNLGGEQHGVASVICIPAVLYLMYSLIIFVRLNCATNVPTITPGTSEEEQQHI